MSKGQRTCENQLRLKLLCIKLLSNLQRDEFKEKSTLCSSENPTNDNRKCKVRSSDYIKSDVLPVISLTVWKIFNFSGLIAAIV